MNLRKVFLERTNQDVSWNIFQADHYKIKRVCMIFETIPETVHNVLLYQVNSAHPAYNCVVRSEDPNGATCVSFEDIEGFYNGDFAQLQFTNVDNIYIKGFAVIEI